MRRTFIVALFCLLSLVTCFAHTKTYYRTTKAIYLHYVVMTNETAIVYQIGSYKDKGGSGPAIIRTDTLSKFAEHEWKGNLYTIGTEGDDLLLRSNKYKEFHLEKVTDTERVNRELNHAYYLSSYFEVCRRLNKEFPLNHYSFRDAFYIWDRLDTKHYPHYDFVAYTNKENSILYDTASERQTILTRTTNFIKQNAAKLNYAQLRDSLKSLPQVYRPQSAYFHESVYAIVKANPENFYKILQDFPANKTIIYFAIDDDKELIKQIRNVNGYDRLKKEFVKDYNLGRSMPYRVFGMYALVGGLVVLLLVNQKN